MASRSVRGRLDRARSQFVHDALDLDLGRSGVDEVQLVLPGVRVAPGLDSWLEHERVDPEGLEAEPSAELAHQSSMCRTRGSLMRSVSMCDA